MDNIFSSIIGDSFTISQFLICCAASILLGLAVATCYMYKSRYTKSFVITLATLPIIVQAVILLVNGNLGTAVAVMGAFSLVRFRSVPGTAKEINSIFLAMAIGLATGKGYIGIAIVLAVIVILLNFILTFCKFGDAKAAYKQLRITIPENLDYNSVFDDIFEKYLNKYELNEVRTTNMGSLYKLTYQIEMKDVTLEKEMLDELRCRNGNLDIICSRAIVDSGETL